MLTGDENIVDVQLFVQYLVQDPVKYLFRSRNPEGILHTSAEVALRGVVGQNTIDYTMTEGRVAVQAEVKVYLQNLLDIYQTGLLITEARMLVVDAPREVRDAFHDVVRAREDRERLIKESEGYLADVVPKARGEASEMLRKAEAYKEQRVIRAQGDADRFLKVLKEYQKAKVVTRDRLYLESIERILPATQKFILETGGQKGGGVLPILPLRELTPAVASEKGKETSPTEREGR
jgi:membrane protease subunit HflK